MCEDKTRVVENNFCLIIFEILAAYFKKVEQMMMNN